jgi:hypothetical protein
MYLLRCPAPGIKQNATLASFNVVDDFGMLLQQKLFSFTGTHIGTGFDLKGGKLNWGVDGGGARLGQRHSNTTRIFSN